MLNFRAASLLVATAAWVALPVHADLLLNTQVAQTGQLSILGTSYSLTSVPQTIGNGTNTLTLGIPTVNMITTVINVSAGGDTLTISDQAFAGWSLFAGSITLTDPVFQNFNLTLQSGSSLPNVQLIQSGNSLTFSWAAGASSNTTYSATYGMVDPPVDEPSNSVWSVTGFGLLGLLALGRRLAIRQT